MSDRPTTDGLLAARWRPSGPDARRGAGGRGGGRDPGGGAAAEVRAAAAARRGRTAAGAAFAAEILSGSFDICALGSIAQSILLLDVTQ